MRRGEQKAECTEDGRDCRLTIPQIRRDYIHSPSTAERSGIQLKRGVETEEHSQEVRFHRRAAVNQSRVGGKQ